MKREEHKAKIKSRVLLVAKELFNEKGYAKTPISEITQKAGITTGSLYHFFKNKEDILLHLVQEMFDLTIMMADQLVGEKADPWMRLYVEIAMQFSLILKHEHIAELYLISNESGLISREIINRAHVRNMSLFKPVLPDLSEDDLYSMTLVIKGIIHSYIQDWFYSDTTKDPTLSLKLLDHLLTVFRLPPEKKSDTMAQIRELIKLHSEMFKGLIVSEKKQINTNP